MQESAEIVCPHCGAVNRVQGAKLGDRPKCGRCKQDLFISQPSDFTSANFDKIISRNQIPVVVFFWAPWCGYCRMMNPVFQQAAAQLEPRFRLGKVNTEAEPILSNRFGVKGVPTTIIFKNGREVARQSGAMDRMNLLRWVEANA